MGSDFEKVINLSETSLGIELGSTRIKSVLINDTGDVLATGYYEWENKLKDGIWTYDMSDVWAGIQSSYKQLKSKIYDKYGLTISKVGAIGISAMMHGYLPFDKNDNQLSDFRTWRNSMTSESETKLTKLFNHNIPQRWSIAHLYQSMLNNESHILELDFFTTLAGYVHWQLTGEKVIGIGDASGMFPINSAEKNYDNKMISLFHDEVSSMGYSIDLNVILPKVLEAGLNAGFLTDKGSILLDPDRDLISGVPFAPPEGDAGTGMVATNSVSVNTGNISAGTSVFAMIVLEKELSKVYPEIDIVVTPSGAQVAMVHVNNCTTEINTWISIFEQFSQMIGSTITREELYNTLFESALDSDSGVEGILSYGYHSGENITKVDVGRPLLVRKPDINFSVNNLMRSILDGAFATLHIGLNILLKEGVTIETMLAHGGIFKTEFVAQKILASSVGSPVSLMNTANEGGAWGMAILASYLTKSNQMTLDEYLSEVIFKNSQVDTYIPTNEEIESYKNYVLRFEEGLEIEKISNVFK